MNTKIIALKTPGLHDHLSPFIPGLSAFVVEKATESLLEQIFWNNPFQFSASEILTTVTACFSPTTQDYGSVYTGLSIAAKELCGYPLTSEERIYKQKDEAGKLSISLVKELQNGLLLSGLASMAAVGYKSYAAGVKSPWPFICMASQFCGKMFARPVCTVIGDYAAEAFIQKKSITSELQKQTIKLCFRSFFYSLLTQTLPRVSIFESHMESPEVPFSVRTQTVFGNTTQDSIIKKPLKSGTDYILSFAQGVVTSTTTTQQYTVTQGETVIKVTVTKEKESLNLTFEGGSIQNQQDILNIMMLDYGIGRFAPQQQTAPEKDPSGTSAPSVFSRVSSVVSTLAGAVQYTVTLIRDGFRSPFLFAAAESVPQEHLLSEPSAKVVGSIVGSHAQIKAFEGDSPATAVRHISELITRLEHEQTATAFGFDSSEVAQLQDVLKTMPEYARLALSQSGFQSYPKAPPEASSTYDRLFNDPHFKHFIETISEKIQNLAVDSHMFIPIVSKVGQDGHAMFFKIEKTSSTNIILSIGNTGAGLQFHGRDPQSGLHQLLSSSLTTVSEVLQHLPELYAAAFVDSKDNVEELYRTFFRRFQTPAESDRLIRPQFYGNCWSESVIKILKDSVPEALYKKFRWTLDYAILSSQSSHTLSWDGTAQFVRRVALPSFHQRTTESLARGWISQQAAEAGFKEILRPFSQDFAIREQAMTVQGVSTELTPVTVLKPNLTQTETVGQVEAQPVFTLPVLQADTVAATLFAFNNALTADQSRGQRFKLWDRALIPFLESLPLVTDTFWKQVPEDQLEQTISQLYRLSTCLSGYSSQDSHVTVPLNGWQTITERTDIKIGMLHLFTVISELAKRLDPRVESYNCMPHRGYSGEKRELMFLGFKDYLPQTPYAVSVSASLTEWVEKEKSKGKPLLPYLSYQGENEAFFDEESSANNFITDQISACREKGTCSRDANNLYSAALARTQDILPEWYHSLLKLGVIIYTGCTLFQRPEPRELTPEIRYGHRVFVTYPQSYLLKSAALTPDITFFSATIDPNAGKRESNLAIEFLKQESQLKLNPQIYLQFTELWHQVTDFAFAQLVSKIVSTPVLLSAPESRAELFRLLNRPFVLDQIKNHKGYAKVFIEWLTQEIGSRMQSSASQDVAIFNELLFWAASLAPYLKESPGWTNCQELIQDILVKTLTQKSMSPDRLITVMTYLETSTLSDPKNVAAIELFLWRFESTIGLEETSPSQKRMLERTFGNLYSKLVALPKEVLAQAETLALQTIAVFVPDLVENRQHYVYEPFEGVLKRDGFRVGGLPHDIQRHALFTFKGFTIPNDLQQTLFYNGKLIQYSNANMTILYAVPNQDLSDLPRHLQDKLTTFGGCIITLKQNDDWYDVLINSNGKDVLFRGAPLFAESSTHIPLLKQQTSEAASSHIYYKDTSEKPVEAVYTVRIGETLTVESLQISDIGKAVTFQPEGLSHLAGLGIDYLSSADKIIIPGLSLTFPDFHYELLKKDIPELSNNRYIVVRDKRTGQEDVILFVDAPNPNEILPIGEKDFWKLELSQQSKPQLFVRIPYDTLLGLRPTDTLSRLYLAEIAFYNLEFNKALWYLEPVFELGTEAEKTIARHFFGKEFTAYEMPEALVVKERIKHILDGTWTSTQPTVTHHDRVSHLLSGLTMASASHSSASTLLRIANDTCSLEKSPSTAEACRNRQQELLQFIMDTATPRFSSDIERLHHTSLQSTRLTPSLQFQTILQAVIASDTALLLKLNPSLTQQGLTHIANACLHFMRLDTVAAQLEKNPDTPAVPCYLDSHPHAHEFIVREFQLKSFLRHNQIAYIDLLLNPENTFMQARTGFGKTTLVSSLVRIIAEKGIVPVLVIPEAIIGGTQQTLERVSSQTQDPIFRLRFNSGFQLTPRFMATFRAITEQHGTILVSEQDLHVFKFMFIEAVSKNEHIDDWKEMYHTLFKTSAHLVDEWDSVYAIDEVFIRTYGESRPLPKSAWADCHDFMRDFYRDPVLLEFVNKHATDGLSVRRISSSFATFRLQNTALLGDVQSIAADLILKKLVADHSELSEQQNHIRQYLLDIKEDKSVIAAVDKTLHNYLSVMRGLLLQVFPISLTLSHSLDFGRYKKPDGTALPNRHLSQPFQQGIPLGDSTFFDNNYLTISLSIQRILTEGVDIDEAQSFIERINAHIEKLKRSQDSKFPLFIEKINAVFSQAGFHNGFATLDTGNTTHMEELQLAIKTNHGLRQFFIDVMLIPELRVFAQQFSENPVDILPSHFDGFSGTLGAASAMGTLVPDTQESQRIATILRRNNTPVSDLITWTEKTVLDNWFEDLNTGKEAASRVLIDTTATVTLSVDDLSTLIFRQVNWVDHIILVNPADGKTMVVSRKGLVSEYSADQPYPENAVAFYRTADTRGRNILHPKGFKAKVLLSDRIDPNHFIQAIGRMRLLTEGHHSINILMARSTHAFFAKALKTTIEHPLSNEAVFEAISQQHIFKQKQQNFQFRLQQMMVIVRQKAFALLAEETLSPQLKEVCLSAFKDDVVSDPVALFGNAELDLTPYDFLQKTAVDIQQKFTAILSPFELSDLRKLATQPGDFPTTVSSKNQGSVKVQTQTSTETATETETSTNTQTRHDLSRLQPSEIDSWFSIDYTEHTHPLPQAEKLFPPEILATEMFLSTEKSSPLTDQPIYKPASFFVMMDNKIYLICQRDLRSFSRWWGNSNYCILPIHEGLPVVAERNSKDIPKKMRDKVDLYRGLLRLYQGDTYLSEKQLKAVSAYIQASGKPASDWIGFLHRRGAFYRVPQKTIDESSIMAAIKGTIIQSANEVNL